MEKTGKIVYLINSVPSCKDDVDRLIPAFRNLGYGTKTFENPISYQSLQEELDKLDNRAMIKEAIIICHGYGFPGKNFYDYLYLGNDALSYQMFVDMFHPDIHVALFTAHWFKRYDREKNGPIIPSDYSFTGCDHMKLQINDTSENGSLLARYMSQALDHFASSNADQVDFIEFYKKVANPIKELKPGNQYVLSGGMYRCKRLFYITKSVL